MLSWFKCKHPAAALYAKGEQVVIAIDDEFEKITYRMLCSRCGSEVNFSHCRFTHGARAIRAMGVK
jgi:hypothetical protein